MYCWITTLSQRPWTMISFFRLRTSSRRSFASARSNLFAWKSSWPSCWRSPVFILAFFRHRAAATRFLSRRLFCGRELSSSGLAIVIRGEDSERGDIGNTSGVCSVGAAATGSQDGVGGVANAVGCPWFLWLLHVVSKSVLCGDSL